MQDLTASCNQTLVRHFLNQGVFDDIQGILSLMPFVEEFESLKLLEPGGQRIGPIPHGCQQTWRKGTAEDSSGLEQTLRDLWQAVNTCHQHPLNSCGYRHGGW